MSTTEKLDTLVTPRVALAALLQACLGGAETPGAKTQLAAAAARSPTPPRPLRIVGPRLMLLDSLASRADLFIETTGINVAFDLPSFGVYTQRRPSLLLDHNPPNATHGYDAIVASPTAFGDAAQVPGKLLDISRLVSGDPSLSDILPAFRAAAMYDGGVMAIPLVPAPFLLFYRLDIFQRDNLTVPQTWEQFADLAERYHNGPDGLVGSCVIPIGASCRAESLFFRALLSSYIQTHGPSQGVVWDAETMRPLLNSEAAARTLQIFRRLTASGPTWSHAPDCVQNDFNKGRCFMSIGHGSRFKDGSIGAPGVTRARGRMGIAAHPGTTRVLDRATLKLVPCDKERCPLAEEVVMEDGVALVNRPILLQSTVVMLNGLSPLQYQFYAYGLFSMLSSSSLLGVGGGNGLLLDPNELLPMRQSDFSSDQLQYWVQEGYDAGDAARFLAVYRKTATSENIVSEIKIRMSTNVTAALYAAALTFNSPATSASALPGILARMESALDAIVAAEGGTDAFAQQYRRSLNWMPKTATTARAIVTAGDQQAAAAAAGTSSGQTDGSPPTTLVLAVAIPCGCAVLAAVALAVFVRRRQHQIAGNAGGSADSFESAPGVSADTTCLTLVVTDIYESTTLWEKLPVTVMDAAVSIHHAIIRQALAARKGYEAATEGDSFILSFKGPADAAAFCLYVQQALLTAPWPAELMQHRDLEGLAAGPGGGDGDADGGMDAVDWWAAAAAVSPTATVALVPRRGPECTAVVGASRSSRRIGLNYTFKRLAIGKRAAADRSMTAAGRDQSLMISSSRRPSALFIGASMPSFLGAPSAIAATASPRIAAAFPASQGSSFVCTGWDDRPDPALDECSSATAGAATGGGYNCNGDGASLAGMGGGCGRGACVDGVRAAMDTVAMPSLPSPPFTDAAGCGVPRMQTARGSRGEWPGRMCVSSRALQPPPPAAVRSPLVESPTTAASPSRASAAYQHFLRRTASEGSAAAAIAELVAADRMLDATQQLSTILDDDLPTMAAVAVDSDLAPASDSEDVQQADGSTGPPGSSSTSKWATAGAPGRSKTRSSGNGSALLGSAAATISMGGKTVSGTTVAGAAIAAEAPAAATGCERRRAQSVGAMLLRNHSSTAAASVDEVATDAAVQDVEAALCGGGAAAARPTAVAQASGPARETCSSMAHPATADARSVGSSGVWATDVLGGGSSVATTNVLLPSTSVTTARTMRLLPGSFPQQALLDVASASLAGPHKAFAGSCDGAAPEAIHLPPAAAAAGARARAAAAYTTLGFTSPAAAGRMSRKRLLRASVDMLLPRQRAPSATQQQRRPPSLPQGLYGAWASVGASGGAAGAGSPGSSKSRAADSVLPNWANPVDHAAAPASGTPGLSPFTTLSPSAASPGGGHGVNAALCTKAATAVKATATLAEQLRCTWATAETDAARLQAPVAVVGDGGGNDASDTFSAYSATQQTFEYDDGSTAGQGNTAMSPRSAAALAHRSSFNRSAAPADAVGAEPSAGPGNQHVVFRGLRVRMGIHSSCGSEGEVEVSRNAASGRVQYSGALLRLAKAVSDVGQGGMILLSQATRDALQQAAEGESPAALQKALGGPFVVLWMGKHTFADGAGDAHLYQVVSMRLLGRLALQLQTPERTLLRKCAPVPPLERGVFDAPTAGMGTLARISVVGAPTLMAWNAEVTTRALALMYEMLLEELRCAVEAAAFDGAAGTGTASQLPSQCQPASCLLYNPTADSSSGPIRACVVEGSEQLMPAAPVLLPRPLSRRSTGGAADAGVSATPSGMRLAGAAAGFPAAAAAATWWWPQQKRVQDVAVMSGFSSKPDTAGGAKSGAARVMGLLGTSFRAKDPATCIGHPAAMTVAFSGPPSIAAQWLLSCMTRLPTLDWPPELLEHPLAEDIAFGSGTGAVLVRMCGLRAAAALACGDLGGAALVPGALSGSLRYQDTAAAAVLRKAAAATKTGQVVTDAATAALLAKDVVAKLKLLAKETDNTRS